MIPSVSPSPATAPPAPMAQLRQAAEKLEAAFLAEMLRSAGLGKSGSAFGGGAGEDQFGSFLIDAQAAEMARAGGVGLAESIIRAMGGRDDA